MNPLRLAILVSAKGRGTNLQAIMDACAESKIDAEVAVVIGTKRDSPPIERALAKGVPVRICSPLKYEGDDESYGEALLDILRSRQVELICLAGYMRRLPPAVVSEFRDRVLNTHPALLPKFGGKGMYGENVHRAVIESGETVSGCTIHLADEEYDTGPIVLQKTVPVLPGDTPADLAARILPVEHEAYVEAIRRIAVDRDS